MEEKVACSILLHVKVILIMIPNTNMPLTFTDAYSFHFCSGVGELHIADGGR